MWLAIIYVCLATKVCGFIDSPPVYSKADCQLMLDKASIALESDPSVIAYDATCINVQMMEIRRS